MPLYEYRCARCGSFTLMRTVEGRDLPAPCPECRNPAPREIAVPNFSLMSPQRRNAHARNEKSRHEPVIGGRHQCGTGCGCGPGKQAKGNRRLKVPKLGQLEAPKKPGRPWMLGH